MATQTPIIERHPLGLTVIRGFFSEEEQRKLYEEELYKPGVGTRHRKRLEEPGTAAPVFYSQLSADLLSEYKNVFTHDSNIPEPKTLLSKANEAIQLSLQAQDASLDEKYKLPGSLKIDNLYAQLYPGSGKAAAHTDPYLSWVVSISFGAACDFTFGALRSDMKHTIKIGSGDVVVFNGGKVFHSIPKIHPEEAPKYWKQREVETFGLARCNIQLRDRSTVDPNVPDAWKDMYVK